VGSAAPALVIAALVAGVADARAEACTGVTPAGGRFATCFDLGNRLSVTAGSDGVGGAIAVRHLVHFEDEPDLVWKLEHVIADAHHGGWARTFTGTLYRGHFVRHARDGHLVLPLGAPKKIFLPFDIGALAEAGSVRWDGGDRVEVGVVRTAALVDFGRTRGFRRRIAFGPVARWDIDVDRGGDTRVAIADHAVAPFTVGMVNLHLESKDGILAGDLRAEAGTVWHRDGAWHPEATVEASLERIVLAVNDRPIALVLGAKYASATDEAIARIGARIVLFHRQDARVSLRR